MSINRNYRDIFARSCRTFVWVALPIAMVDAPVLAVLGAGLGGFIGAFVMNVFNISPVSSLGRGASTFIQAFMVVWAASGYSMSKAVIMSAASAGMAALYNFVRATL